MNKIMSVIVAMMVYGTCQAQQSMHEKLVRTYDQLKNDVQLIQTCLFQKLRSCAPQERQKAMQSLGRVSATVVVLIGGVILAAGSVWKGGRFLAQQLSPTDEKYFELKPLGGQPPLVKQTIDEQFAKVVKPARDEIKEKLGIDLSEKELKFGDTDIVLHPAEHNEELVRANLQAINTIISNHFPHIRPLIWEPESGGWITLRPKNRHAPRNR